MERLPTTRVTRHDGTRIYNVTFIRTEPRFILEEEPGNPHKQVPGTCLLCQAPIFASDKWVYLTTNGDVKTVCQGCGEKLGFFDD